MPYVACGLDRPQNTRGQQNQGRDRSSTPCTAIPKSRNGNKNIHTIGYRISANSASGQHKTSSTHHNRNFIAQPPLRIKLSVQRFDSPDPESGPLSGDSIYQNIRMLSRKVPSQETPSPTIISTMLLEGIFPPITTPFYPDGSLYLRKLEHNVALYSRTQLSGMVVLGSTGEAVMLSTEEQREVLANAIAAAAPDKVMIAGVGQESVLQTLAMAEHAASLHYDAVLVRTPHFYRRQLHRENGTQLEMLTYYRTVADNSPLPVLLYNVPFFTAYDMPVELIAELAHHPNIIGIKESSGNVENIAAIVESTRFVKRTVTVTPTFAAVTERMLQHNRPTPQHGLSPPMHYSREARRLRSLLLQRR